MLKLLAIVGYILLAAIILILWVIIIPRTVYIEYTQNNSITVKLRVFLFKISLYPPPKNPFKRKEKPLQEKVLQDPAPEDFPQGQAEDTANQTHTKSLPYNDNRAENGQTKVLLQPSDDTQTKKPKDKKKSSRKDAEPKIKADKDGIFDKLPINTHLIKEALSAANGVIKILLKGIYIKNVSFILPITGQNAYSTQQNYAKITTAFYSFNIFLQRYVKIFYKKPMFVADFANLYSESIYFYCKIQASPSIMLIVAWYLFKKYRKLIKESKKEI